MRILIIRFSSFGDIILTTPIINQLYKKYPNVKIDFLVYGSFSDAITLNPKITNYYYFDKKMNNNMKYISNLIKNIEDENYDYIIDLHSKFLSKYIGKRISRNSSAIYFKYKKRKLFKTILVKMRLIKYKADMSIVKSYFTAVEKLGVKYVNEELDFYFTKEVEKEITDKYNLRNRNYIILAPGASKVTKEWVYYNELAIKISNETNYEVIVIGGKKDKLKVNEDKKIQNLAGELNFKESGVMLKYATMAVTNDSGPLHISRAMGVKTIAIFGPTDQDMFCFNNKTYPITSKQKCSPCSLHGDSKCPKVHFNCMKKLTYNEVYENIIKIIEN